MACGRAVAASNLLKCAISGNDPNWGRVVSSLGTVPADVAPYDPNEVSVTINGVRICANGGPDRDRSEVDMTLREIDIDIDLNAGRAKLACGPTTLPTNMYISTRITKAECDSWQAPLARTRYHLDVHTGSGPDQKAEVLIEALPWLEEFFGKTIVIKYGGNAW